MPRYLCPECRTILKKDKPVASGKKIKCPKCAKVFAAVDLDVGLNPPAKPKAAEADDGMDSFKLAPMAEAPKKSIKEQKVLDDEEHEGGGVYLTKAEEESKPNEDINYGSLRDKFKKSKKGPAMAKTIRPSNWLTFWGFFTALLGVVGIVIAIWPYVYSEKTLSKNEQTSQILIGAGGFMNVLVGAIVCWGSSKLQNLESYPLAWLGCVLGLPVGLWGIIVLSDPIVKAGFQEVEDPDGLRLRLYPGAAPRLRDVTVIGNPGVARSQSGAVAAIDCMAEQTNGKGGRELLH